MFRNHSWIIGLAGLCAGAVTGLFGAGGGMVLVPLLTYAGVLKAEEIFPASVTIIFTVCVVSLIITARIDALPWRASFPYLIGSGIGGFAAGKWGRNIPVKWLHKGLGILILWGGIRYLC